MDFWGPKIAEDAVNNFIEVLAQYPSGLRKDRHKAFIIKALSVFYLPHPSKTYIKYASKEFSVLTVSGLIRQLMSSSYVTNSMVKNVFNACTNVGLATNVYGGNKWYRLRTFENNGVYPDRDFTKHNASYVVSKGRPFIITLNYRNAENHASGEGNENSVLTRKEVKLLSSLMCSQYWGTRFSLVDDIEGSRTIDVNYEVLKDVNEDDLLEVLLDYSILTGNRLFSGFEHFNFIGHETAYDEASHFFRKYSLNDALLLRTSFLHIKASSMFGIRNYYEDAVSNIFIGLEGALVMLQRDDGIRYDRINRPFHQNKFNAIFNHGDWIYDFVMDEVFEFGEKRASLVHPQAGTEWSWVPYLSHEDYRDYRDILKQLMYYSVTGEKLADPYDN